MTNIIIVIINMDNFMKKIISIFLCAALLVFYINPIPVNAEETETDILSLESKSAILIEVASGQVIYEKNPDEMLRPASVTKIMTLLLIFEEIEAGNMCFDDIVTVTEHAASMGGSQCFFEAGEQQTVQDYDKMYRDSLRK